jgi:hypothetical protein
MPAWEALYIMGITSGVIAGVLFFALFIIIRKQLRSPETQGQKIKERNEATAMPKK